MQNCLILLLQSNLHCSCRQNEDTKSSKITFFIFWILSLLDVKYFIILKCMTYRTQISSHQRQECSNTNVNKIQKCLYKTSFKNTVYLHVWYFLLIDQLDLSIWEGISAVDNVHTCPKIFRWQIWFINTFHDKVNRMFSHVSFLVSRSEDQLE